MHEYGSAVTRARQRKKWSQRKLSLVTGLSRSLINDIERGRCAGAPKTWVTLARTLGFSLDEVFLGVKSGEQKKGG